MKPHYGCPKCGSQAAVATAKFEGEVIVYFEDYPEPDIDRTQSLEEMELDQLDSEYVCDKCGETFDRPALFDKGGNKIRPPMRLFLEISPKHDHLWEDKLRISFGSLSQEEADLLLAKDMEPFKEALKAHLLALARLAKLVGPPEDPAQAEKPEE